jgi:sugar O-acyltransferase (sialic acid O-acetyltransferase NeuD family)
MSLPVILVGAGGHARVLLDLLGEIGREVKGVLTPDREYWDRELKGIPILGGDDRINLFGTNDIEIVNGIGSVGDPSTRIKVFLAMKGMGFFFATIKHPSAIIAKDVSLGEGTQIMAGAVIQPGCMIGENVIINTGAIVDHDCRVGNHVQISPGAVLSGGVGIGSKTHIGTGVSVIQGIRIGVSVLVAAGSVVTRDIPDNVCVRGVPAQIIK